MTRTKSALINASRMHSRSSKITPATSLPDVTRQHLELRAAVGSIAHTRHTQIDRVISVRIAGVDREKVYQDRDTLTGLHIIGPSPHRHITCQLRRARWSTTAIGPDPHGEHPRHRSITEDPQVMTRTLSPRQGTHMRLPLLRIYLVRTHHPCLYRQCPPNYLRDYQH